MTEYEAIDERYYRLHVPRHEFSDYPPEALAFPLPDDVRGIAKKRPGRRYMFRPGQVIFRAAEVDDELERLLTSRDIFPYTEEPPQGDDESAQRERARVNDAQRALEQAGLVTFRMSNLTPERTRDDVPSLVQELRTPRQGRGRTGKTWDAWPNLVLAAEQDAEYGPFGPPTSPPIDVTVGPPTTGPGHGIFVAVIDTGLRPDHLMLAGNSHTGSASDLEVTDEDGDGVRDFVAGHGTFVAGIIRQLAPGAEILGLGTVRSNGTVSDAEIAGAINKLSNVARIDILNLSLGGYAHGGNATGLPCTTIALAALRVKHPNVEVVAAAGNNGKAEPFFPAALPDVKGVGALDVDGKKAKFSNKGPWVKAWELGVGLTSSYVGPSLTQPGGGPTHLGATVTWQGTSFAAARVTGTLAASMAP